jgi:very-short-patch-repair endonuclease
VVICGTVKDVTTIDAAFSARGPAMHAQTLRDAGVSQQELERLASTGRIERIRPGWYCLHGDSSDTVKALRVGGRLACVSVLRTYGVWLMPDARLHVSTVVARSRLRAPTTRVLSLDEWHGSPEVITHWRETRKNPHEPLDVIDDAAACVALCLPRDHAIVAFDSMLNSKLLSADRLRMALAGLPDSHEWMMDLVDAGCGSGLETLARLHIRSRRIRVRAQVYISGVGWVDLLIGDRLVMELDSRTHHDNPQAYERDRARDLALVAMGYVVIRVSYRKVMYDWASVEDAILAVVRRNEHKWQTVHRSAGIAVSMD